MNKDARTSIDTEVSHILAQMAKMEVDSEEYEKAAANLEAICRARSYKDDRHVSKEFLLGIGTSLLEVAMMLWFERVNVITSKVLSRIWHSRP